MKKSQNRFHLLSLLMMAVVTCSVILIGCQDDTVISSGAQEDAEHEDVSEITLIENELGVSFFTKDVTVIDETGENKVTIRIAALDESMLTEYLKYRKFSIEPIFQRQNKGTTIELTQKTGAVTPEADTYEERIFIEVINQQLGDGVIGVGFRNEVNPLYKFDESGRIKYNHQVTHTSHNWPTWLDVQAFDQVTFMVGFKDRWHTNWYPVAGPLTWTYDFYSFYVDGPWRVRLDIAYNYREDYYYAFF